MVDLLPGIGFAFVILLALGWIGLYWVDCERQRRAAAWQCLARLLKRR